MMTFSLRPSSSSRLPLIAASVRTLVVSWKLAADRKLSVSRDALVIPSSTGLDRKSTRLNSSHVSISYAVFCLKKKSAGQVKRDGEEGGDAASEEDHSIGGRQ